jgi:L-2-hydroxycarboxylate dehydrogenase (NAD+)
MKLSKEVLYNGLKKVLLHQGVSVDDATVISDFLLEGTLRGFHYHGVDRIFQILDGFKQGTVFPNSSPSVLTETRATATWNGNYGLGQPIGKMAMELAIKKAKENGVGVVGVINTSHLGILACYTELASSSECVGVALTTTSPAVVAKGGKLKIFGTNPISYSIPNEPYPITADFSTSAVSRGEIYDYIEKGLNIPLGWAVDREGKETVCPKEALEGGLTTFDNNIKGNLLSLLFSVLAGNLIGGVSNPQVKGTRYMHDKPNKGDLFLAFHVNSFTNQQIFKEGIREMVCFLNNQNAQFRVPGERAFLSKNAGENEIHISKNLYNLLKEYV